MTHEKRFDHKVEEEKKVEDSVNFLWGSSIFVGTPLFFVINEKIYNLVFEELQLTKKYEILGFILILYLWRWDLQL